MGSSAEGATFLLHPSAKQLIKCPEQQQAGAATLEEAGAAAGRCGLAVTVIGIPVNGAQAAIYI